MGITFQVVNNSGKVVGIGSNEKSKSIFSKLASSISSIKNNIVSFFSKTESNVTIGDPINLNQMQKDLLNKDEEKGGVRHIYNKSAAKNLKESINESIAKFPQEIEYTSFEKKNNPPTQKIKLDNNLWISSKIYIDEPQLENERPISHIQYESSPYFQSINNKNTFNN